MADVIPVIHNVSSVQRVVDMARLVYSLGFDKLAVTKAYGGAAQAGIPEAMRIALRESKTLIVLPDLEDLVRLVEPPQVILVTHDYAEERLEPQEIAGLLNGGGLLVFSGSDPDFSTPELRLGRRVYLARAAARIGAIGEAALILYYLSQPGGRSGNG